MLVALALIAIIIGGLIYVWLSWNFDYWRKRGVPGPAGHLLSGSFPMSFYQQRNMVYDVDEAYRKYRHRTPYFGIFMSRMPSLVITDPDMVKQVLITNFTSFHDNSIPVRIDKETDPLLGRNPFMLKGEEWKEKRGEVTPAFTNIRLKNMYPIMEHVAKSLTKYLTTKLEAKPDGVDVKDLGSRFTADSVANSIFGVDGKALSGEYSEILERGTTIFDNSVVLILYSIIALLIPSIGRYWTMNFIPKAQVEFFEKLTRDAIEMREKSNISREDFLSYLIQLRKKKQLQDIEMTAHAMTFFLDGYETSSMVIANTINQLARNPEVQNKLRSEIESVVAPGEAISFEQISELEYLTDVINETLRLRPVLGVASKICTENIELTDYKDHKLTVEKGMIVFIPIYSIQHDEDHYADPEVFNPDRFSADQGGLKHYKDKGVFLSFGDGPRICLGMRFGLLQVKVAIVELMRNFVFKPHSKTNPNALYDPTNFLLTQLGGLWVDFVPIKLK